MLLFTKLKLYDILRRINVCKEYKYEREKYTYKNGFVAVKESTTKVYLRKQIVSLQFWIQLILLCKAQDVNNRLLDKKS